MFSFYQYIILDIVKLPHLEVRKMECQQFHVGFGDHVRFMDKVIRLLTLAALI